MAVTHDNLRTLVRTARMLLMKEQRPDHNGAKDHKRSITFNRAKWDQLSPEDRSDTIEAAKQIHDMTPQLIESAVAELES